MAANLGCVRYNVDAISAPSGNLFLSLHVVHDQGMYMHAPHLTRLSSERQLRIRIHTHELAMHFSTYCSVSNTSTYPC